MAEVTRVTKITLVLDEYESGYLLNLLGAHVAGDLLRDGAPLERIHRALYDAGVKEILARNTSPTGTNYATLSSK